MTATMAPLAANQGMNQATGPILWDINTTAQRLGVSRAFLYREMAAGRIRYLRLGPRKRRFTLAEVEAYCERLMRETEAGAGARHD